MHSLLAPVVVLVDAETKKAAEAASLGGDKGDRTRAKQHGLAKSHVALQASRSVSSIHHPFMSGLIRTDLARRGTLVPRVL